MGSHMRLVHLDGVEHGCCGPAARADAEEVARIGGFPFEIAEMTREFEQRVIADFVAEHEAGRTPEPVRPMQRRDQVRRVPAAGRRARHRLGGDRATTCGPTAATTARWHLRRGADRAKDQSYMLHMLGPGAARAVPVPGRGHAEARDAGARRAVRPAGRDEARLAGALLRAERRRRRVRAIAGAGARAPGGRGGRPRRPRRSASTTARSRSRWASGAASGSRWARPPTCSRSTPPRNRVVVGPRELLSRRGLVADRASWVAGRAARRRSVRGRGADPLPRRRRPRGDRADGPTAFRVEFRSPQRAIAPGPERGRLPRRRDARRRPHRRVVPLIRRVHVIGGARGRRLPRLSSPSDREEGTPEAV